jgi:hypothetical protein
MPILDGSLKQQVFNIETRMADRVEKVFLHYIESPDYLDNIGAETSKQLLDWLLIQYENAIKAMQEEVIKPTEWRDPTKNPSMPNMMESSDVVKRLNKGYLRFVYDTTEERIKQYFTEKQMKDTLNPTDEETPPQESKPIHNDEDKPEDWVDFI